MEKRWRKYSIVPDEEIDFIISKLRVAPPGDVIVAGTYMGGDVMAISESDPSRNICVIDSFCGLAEPTDGDDGTHHHNGEFNVGGIDCYLQNFMSAGYLAPKEIHEIYINVESLKKIKRRPIALVWLDLDHYQPTLDCINNFWPWIESGGTMLTHDYLWPACPGIERAVKDSELPWHHGERTIAYVTKP